jgi:hypothetical protein
MNKSYVGALGLALAAMVGAAYADPVITDGSFENPDYADTGIYSGGGDGWTTSFHGAVAIIAGNITDNYGNQYGATPFGDQYLGLDPRTRGFVSSDSQTISGFVAGQTYALTLYVADSDGGSAPQLEILLSNDSDTTYLDRYVDVAVGGPYGDVIDFQKVVTTFTATITGDITLSLINSGNPYASPGADPGSISIDNVSIATISAVPEPASLLTMMLGGLLVGARSLKAGKRAPKPA